MEAEIYRLRRKINAMIDTAKDVLPRATSTRLLSVWNASLDNAQRWNKAPAESPSEPVDSER